MPKNKETHDTLVIHVSPDTSVHKVEGMPWFARMEIKCDLLKLMDEGFFLTADGNIETSKGYVTNKNDPATRKLFKRQPEWTGTIHISANSRGAWLRCHIDEWDHTNIYEVYGKRRGEDGELKLAYYYLCFGDENINCVYGDRRALKGFWAWPQEEHVQLNNVKGSKETSQDEKKGNVGYAEQPPSYQAAGSSAAGNH
ncbi:hypothetical protein QBC37DRAFT_453400 [Rhypophila decipiens]|uniref:Uncharacterized protein n=1 Tax=Rhypophila decipiens TaxID=261697 RepID=A0AAN7B375_9PEZI|nr:hypothetical protein QBC37DRAFT_453400 [Rhypophila decipiens]